MKNSGLVAINGLRMKHTTEKRREVVMVSSTFPNVLRIRKSWNWNPVTWTWLNYDMKVHTKFNDEEVIGTLSFKQRGPYHSTTVTYP